MQRIFRNIFLLSVTSVIVTASVFLLSTHSAHARIELPVVSIWEILTTAGEVVGKAAANAVLETIGLILEFTLIPFSGYLLAGSGLLLDAAILVTLDGTYYNIPAVVEGWRIFRDLANIVLIFVFLAIGIATILGVTGYGIKKMLPKLIVAALLINFSLFFTQVVIDASNLLGVTIYNAITSNILSTSGGPTSVSLAIKESLDLQTGYADPNYGAEYFTFAIFRLITILYAAWIFFNAALLFIVRFLVFIFLMILAPIGFVGFLIPGGWGKQWWETLIKNAVLAPIFLIFLYIILSILAAESILLPNAAVNNVAYYLNFIIVLGLLAIALRITKSFSHEAGNKAIGWAGKSVKLLAGGAMLGGVGFAGRQLLGRGASYLAQSERLKEAGQGSGVRGLAARAALSGAKYGGRATYDVRAAPVAAGLAKNAGLGTAGGKGGYDAQLARQVKRRDEMGKTLGAVKKTEVDRKEEEQLRINQSTADRRASEAELSFAGGTITKEARDAARKRAKDAQGAVRVHLKAIEDKGTRRKQQYATTLATEKTFLDTLGRKVPRKNKEAADKIRKGEKKVEDYVKDALKASGELKDEKPAEPEDIDKESKTEA